ncbi:MAG: ABC transporter ATP-binding protein [bacterium]|nr:ABC transporter ATP-binding protein [bacterium]
MIRVRSLTKRFATVTAVDGLDLDVQAGEVFGLLGPNGAGKTTTVRMLGGLLLPSQGDAFVGGCQVTREAPALRRLVGVVNEGAGLYARLTVEENLLFFGTLYGVSGTAARKRMGELCDLLDLGPVAKRRFGELSTGWSKRACLARALLHRPPVLLLDEPWTGLDPAAARTVRLHVSALARDHGNTVLLCTHGLSEAAEICSRVAVMVRGKIAVLGRPGALPPLAGPLRYLVRSSGRLPAGDWWQRQEGVLEARSVAEGYELEVTGEAVVEALLPALLETGAAVREIRRTGPTLEDAYLKVVADGGP